MLLRRARCRFVADADTLHLIRTWPWRSVSWRWRGLERIETANRHLVLRPSSGEAVAVRVAGAGPDHQEQVGAWLEQARCSAAQRPELPLEGLEAPPPDLQALRIRVPASAVGRIGGSDVS